MFPDRPYQHDETRHDERNRKELRAGESERGRTRVVPEELYREAPESVADEIRRRGEGPLPAVEPEEKREEGEQERRLEELRRKDGERMRGRAGDESVADLRAPDRRARREGDGGNGVREPSPAASVAEASDPAEGVPERDSDREDVEKHPEIKILASSKEAGIYAMATKNGRQIFITGHSEYDPLTIAELYRERWNVELNVWVKNKQEKKQLPMK